jgi:LuxR family maltose regulon positive regulatory protein
MSDRSGSIAKITRPRLSGIVMRERLMRLLDECRHEPVVWITAPAGAGKTTMVASYLDNRAIPSLWYQVDEGDTDLAGFFYYLGVATKKAAPRSRKPLPLFTPEYLQGIPVFTRRYFENLFRLLPPASVLVFENYQDVPDGTGFHEMMANALDVIPHGNQVIIISRSVPPAQFARLRVNNCIRVLGWEDIRFTREESGELLDTHGHGKTADEVLEVLHRKTEGWAAGLILLMARSKTEEPASLSLTASTSRELFDYFASEILNRTEPTIREVLLKTAFFQKVDPHLAKRLTGIRATGEILENLSRGHYFTQRYEQEYQYHPLFREFLLTRAYSVLSPDEISVIRSQAARLLEEAGRIEEAVTLYREAEEWNGLIRLILGHARILLEQGRWKTLNEWLTGLPAEIVDSTPWLIFWLGVSQMPFNPPSAVGYFERSYRQFAEHEDGMGMILSCSSAIDSIVHGWDDFLLLDTWIDRMEKCSETKNDLSPECAARTMLSLAAAMVIRQPFRSDLAATVENVLTHVRNSSDVNLRFQAFLLAQNYYCWMGDFANSRLMSDESARLSRSPAVSPLLRITWIWIDTVHDMVMTADYDRILQRIEEAFTIARETGVHAMDHMVSGMGAKAALLKGNTTLAKEFMDRFQAQLDPTKRHAYALCHYEWAWYYLLTDDPSQALDHTVIAVRIAEETGYVFPVILCQMALALALQFSGEPADAHTVLSNVGKVVKLAGSSVFRFNWTLIAAHFAFSRHDEKEGLDFLREAITLGRKNKFNSGLWWWHPEVMSDLCARAIAAGLETVYVERMIVNHRLPPPEWAEDLECWPRPLKLYNLGRFELRRDGRPVDLAGKRKVLELLKALVSMEGMAVRQEQVTGLLWPDAEGDDAHSAFKMTLSRLRRLLPDDAILLQEGLLTLNRSLVWNDDRSFEKMAGSALALWDRCREPEASGTKAKELARQAMELTGQALALYRGTFLPSDTGLAWTVSRRERLRNRLLRLVLLAGRHYEEKGKWRSAAEVYLRGVEADPLQEELYQRLMACHQQLGNRVEALAAYERCRAELATQLGIAPSPKTEALRATLRR